MAYDGSADVTDSHGATVDGPEDVVCQIRRLLASGDPCAQAHVEALAHDLLLRQGTMISAHFGGRDSNTDAGDEMAQVSEENACGHSGHSRRPAFRTVPRTADLRGARASVTQRE
jgi:hypothetical protein